MATVIVGVSGKGVDVSVGGAVFVNVGAAVPVAGGKSVGVGATAVTCDWGVSLPISGVAAGEADCPVVVQPRRMKVKRIKDRLANDNWCSRRLQGFIMFIQTLKLA